jgi:NADPH-dependent FMN reductase
MRIAVVTGNPKPASRTHRVALAVAGVLSAAFERPAYGARLVVDLSEHAPSLFDPSAAELSRLTAEVAAADIAIFASPTCKASYTGMLKAFLDRYSSNGLAGTIAVPVMTGGCPGRPQVGPAWTFCRRASLALSRWPIFAGLTSEGSFARRTVGQGTRTAWKLLYWQRP